MKINTTVHPLQTKSWEEFRKAWGNQVARVNNNFLTIHQVPYLKIKFAIFEKGPAPTKKILEDLRQFAKKESLTFIKLEPNIEKSQKLISLLKSSGAIPGKTIFTPTTFQIDLTKSEDELLKNFTSKTRYNIRLAIRKGVTIKEDNSDKAFEKYLELMRETTKMDNFFAHSEKYHKLMWKFMRKEKIAHLLTAVYNKEIITTWILFAYQNVLYYPYGARSAKYKNVMANNLMMWEAIKFGKKNGCTKFDLWGREANKGFTKFKEGYNPKVVEFLGTWDLVINKQNYYLYILLDKIRWFFLRLKSSLIKPQF